MKKYHRNFLEMLVLKVIGEIGTSGKNPSMHKSQLGFLESLNYRNPRLLGNPHQSLKILQGVHKFSLQFKNYITKANDKISQSDFFCTITKVYIVCYILYIIIIILLCIIFFCNDFCLNSKKDYEY